MAQKFTDGARSKLAGAITNSSTSLALLDGSRFPTVDAGTAPVSDANAWCKLVIQDAAGFEIVYARTHDAATTPNAFSNVLRGQDGTTARAFGTDADVGLRPTAGDMDRALNAREPSISKSLGYLKWNGSAWVWADDAYLLASHAASGVTSGKISNWDTAYGWGNHANAGYANAGSVSTALSGKSNTGHTHAISDITNLQTSLDGKQAASSNLASWSGKSVPSGAIVDASTAQTLSNKTLSSPTISGAPTETPFAITDTAGAVINPANGSIQTWTLGAHRTPNLSSIAAGQSVVLAITSGSYVVTWSSVIWPKSGGGGTAPALATSGVNTVVLWKIGTQLYGAYVGA